MQKDYHVVRLSSKGQLVIPASVRRVLGLKAGQPLALRARNGREVVIVPLERDTLDVEAMLHLARTWMARTSRNLVEELHDRRRREREEEKQKLGRRGH
jgi:AbrB family looped-hinge helix DNA binding protein